MGGAADLKVGYKKGFASGAREKMVPPLFQMWGYKQANIYQRINEEEAGK